MITPERARAELDARVAQVQESTKTFLEGLTDGIPLGDVLEFLGVMEPDGGIISRGLCAMLAVDEVSLDVDRRLHLGPKKPEPAEAPNSTEWRKGYVVGFKKGGAAIARDVNAVLDGYDFAGNTLAKAVCEGYRDMIRSRLAFALRDDKAAE